MSVNLELAGTDELTDELVKRFPAKLDRCVADLKKKGVSEDQAWAICSASTKKAGEDMEATTLSEPGMAVQDCYSVLVEKGFSEADAVQVASTFAKRSDAKFFDEMVKKLKDSKNAKAYMGLTEAEEDDADNEHEHEYALMILNFGEQLIGITTKTKGASDHVHLADVNIDGKIKRLTAYTDFGDSKKSDKDESVYHRHVFNADMKELKNQIPSIYVGGMMFADEPAKESEYLAVAYSENRKLGFNNQRQAEALIAWASQLSENPSWHKKELSELQTAIYESVENYYPDSMIFRESHVVELAKKLNRNAMEPMPTSSETYAIRFKGEGSAFFINCASTDEASAKEDAFIYLNNCKGYDIDLIKFSMGKDKKVTFSEVGSFLFYENRKGVITNSSDSAIKLSERDAAGNVVIEIFRTGLFKHPEYGALDIGKDKLVEIKKNFDAGILDRKVSFDFNHEPDLPAAAWVDDLSIARRDVKGRQQDVLQAHVQFTPRGEEAIKNKDFMYFSSEYVDNFVDKESEEEFGTTLKGGGLTNRPWIPALKPIELSEKKEGMGFIKSTK